MPRSILAVVVAILALGAPVPGQGRSPPGGGEPGGGEPEQAQDPQDPQDPVHTQDSIVVTATRTWADAFDLPYSTEVLTAVDLVDRKQSRTLPEALNETAGVSVQKTAHGMGSVKIRAQTGYLTLLLMDGVRINDSTWRSGNNEYWSHFDPYGLERFEVQRGANSVLWGSDAISGLGQGFELSNPSWAEGVHQHGRALFRYASAEDSFTLHADSQGNVDKTFGWHIGGSFFDYGDLSGGSGVGLQPDTAYRAGALDGKLIWNFAEQQSLSFGFQVYDVDDVPRTHSTVNGITWRGLTTGSDLQRSFDHLRQLYWLKWNAEDGAFFDTMAATVAWKDRSEQENRIRSNMQRTVSDLDVQTLGLSAQFGNELGDGVLTWGADWYHDFVDSSAQSFDAGGNLTGTSNRGVVAGDADYDLVGLYAQYDTPLGEGFDLVAGVRGTYAAQDAREVAVPGSPVFYPDQRDHWTQLSGTARLLYDLTESSRLWVGASQGFRAPNLSDTTRFDTARSNELEQPAAGLDPEVDWVFELGGRYDDGARSGSVTGYYQIVRDRILRAPTGQVVNGEQVVTKSNVGDGWYAGLELEGSVTMAGLSSSFLCLDDVRMYGFVDYVAADLSQYDDSGNLIDGRPPAMPPVSGEVGFRWLHPEEPAGAELFVRMAAAVDPGRYTDADRRNTQRIPPDGLPGWAVVGLRAWAELSEHLRVSASVENIGDVDYRIMDSGVNEPGTNFVMTLEAHW